MAHRSKQSIKGGPTYWERRANAMPVTYIVEADGPTGERCIKIGRTSHLSERLKDLKGELGYSVVFLRKIRGKQHYDVLVGALAEYKIEGQWYKRTDDLIRCLNRYRREDQFFQPVDQRPVKISTLD